MIIIKYAYMVILKSRANLSDKIRLIKRLSLLLKNEVAND